MVCDIFIKSASLIFVKPEKALIEAGIWHLVLEHQLKPGKAQVDDRVCEGKGLRLICALLLGR